MSMASTTEESCTEEPWMEEFDARIFLTEEILLILIAILAAAGNTLVLVLTWREKNLHQPNKYFVAFLAVADLLAGIFVVPLNFYSLRLLQQLAVFLPVHLCRFMVWIDTFVLTVSIYTLTAISFDRYLKISKPFQYKSRMTTSTTFKIIFTIVSISAVIATYGATPYSGSQGLLETSNGACPEYEDMEGKVFETFLSISAFILPATIILIMYGLIFRVAHRRNKMLLDGELGQRLNNKKTRTALRQDMKVIRTLFVVVGVFIICWCPWIIWILLWYYYPEFVNWESESTSYWYRVDILSLIARTLPLFNSLCNPIIYAFLDQKYREAFKRLVKRIAYQSNSIRRQPPTECKSMNLAQRHI